MLMSIRWIYCVFSLTETHRHTETRSIMKELFKQEILMLYSMVDNDYSAHLNFFGLNTQRKCRKQIFFCCNKLLQTLISSSRPHPGQTLDLNPH